MNLYNVYGQICRICMNAALKYYNLSEKTVLQIDNKAEELTLHDMLEHIVPTVVPSKDIVLPQEICETCITQLKLLYKFYKMCLTTNQRLIKMWQEAKRKNLKTTKVRQNPTTINAKPKVFSCAICLNTYSTQYMLMAHIYKNHQPKISIELSLPLEHMLSNTKSNYIKHEQPYDETEKCKTNENCLENDSIGTLEQQIGEEFGDIICKDEHSFATEFSEGNALTEGGSLSDNASEYKEYKSPEIVNKHNKKNIKVLQHFNCSQCPSTFTTRTDLRKHKKQHSDIYRYVCFLCNDRFKYPHLVQEHQVRRHGLTCDNKKKPNDSEIYQCNYCEMAYKGVGGLAQHISKRHPTIKPYQCEICEETFVVEEHLRIHTNRHNGIKSFKCDECDKTFTYKNAMKTHMLTHTGEAHHLCSLCGKTFSRLSNFQQHMQRHGNETPYSCPHCPKRFKCQSDRYIHMMTHNEGKIHLCPLCGKGFSRLDTLHQHKILHTGIKRYKCNQCPRTFAAPDNCNRHKRTHTGEKPYKCEFCERAYCQRNDLVKHWRVHLGEKVHRCKQCSEAFKYNAELKKHELEHYPKMPQTSVTARSEINIKS